MPDLHVSYSDHFGIVATFAIQAEGSAPRGAKCESRIDVLQRALLPLREALRGAVTMQKRHLAVFLTLLGLDAILVAALACVDARHRSTASTVFVSLLMVAATWAGTTALYSGVVWGEWHKRALRAFIDEIETEAGIDKWYH